MRVSVTLPFVRGCVQCRTLCEGAAVAAIRDTSVTSFTLQPGKLHAHAVAPGEPQRGIVASEPATTGGSLFPPSEMPHSDTNGFDDSMC